VKIHQLRRLSLKGFGTYFLGRNKEHIMDDTDFWADSLKEEYIMRGMNPIQARIELLRNSKAFENPNATAIEIASSDIA
jgi:hypothetical protein